MARVDRLRNQGLSNRAIAKLVGVSAITVATDMERSGTLWRERCGADMEHWRAKVVADLEDVKLRALEAAALDEAHLRAVLYAEEFEAESGEKLRVHRDDKGAAQYRGQKANHLAVARQAAMDQAKVLGVIIEKSDITSGGLPILMKAYPGVDLDKV